MAPAPVPELLPGETSGCSGATSIFILARAGGQAQFLAGILLPVSCPFGKSRDCETHVKAIGSTKEVCSQGENKMLF